MKARMESRRQFLQRLAERNPTRLEQAIALLWYYERTQLYAERSASDLARDIEEDGFGSQNATRLSNSLRTSRSTVVGAVRGTFRVNAARFQELSENLSELLNINEPVATSTVIPMDFVNSTRRIYLERLVRQINLSYDAGLYDATAVLTRRLAESLIIEVYISQSREQEIRQNGSFMMLNGLISHLMSDTSVTKSRNFRRGINVIKDIGDTAAHDRTYITPKEDIDDNRSQMRRVISELLTLSGIRT